MRMPKFLFRGFSRPSEAIISSLGKLERETMEEVWRKREVCVRDVFLSFDERIAYTTVMTTLDRLFKKGLLERRQQGRAFFYTPKFSLEELEQNVAGDVIGSLLNTADSQIEPVLACIVDAVSERDIVLLDDLARLVEEKRQKLRSELLD